MRHLRDGSFSGRATAADRGRRAGVIAHEIAHMWFGDLVTMRWWDDLWLNESFAEYLAHRCCSEATPYLLWTEFGILRKDWGLVADQSPSTHPVAGQDAADAQVALQNFDGISYAKGAAVVKQLAEHLGEEVFVAGLRSYIDSFAFGNATFQDLIGTWTSAGAADLDPWAQAWLRTAGLDAIDLAWASPTRAMITRTPSAQDSADRVHALAVGSIDPERQPQPARPRHSCRRPIGADRARQRLAGGPGHDRCDLGQDQVRAGRVGAGRPGAAVDHRRAGAGGDLQRDPRRGSRCRPEPRRGPGLDRQRHSHGWPSSIATSVLRFATDQLAGAYCPVPERPARLARVRDVTTKLLAGAEPGSDRQLTAFRLLVRCEDDAGLLRAWLEGRSTAGGSRR